MTDQAFLAEAAQQKLEINTLTGAQLDELIASLMKRPPDISQKMESMTRR